MIKTLVFSLVFFAAVQALHDSKRARCLTNHHTVGLCMPHCICEDVKSYSKLCNEDQICCDAADPDKPKPMQRCTDDYGFNGNCMASCRCNGSMPIATTGTCPQEKDKVCCIPIPEFDTEPCFDNHGSPGECISAEECEADNGNTSPMSMGSCDSDFENVCCVKKKCSIAHTSNCQTADGHEGTCRLAKECPNTFAVRDDCADGVVCCAEKDCSYRHSDVGRACDSENGDGVCSDHCGYGTFDGGYTQYCHSSLRCCVIDYRPSIGHYCTKISSTGYKKEGVCMRKQYCLDDYQDGSNDLCFEGHHCCTKNPDKYDKCDGGDKPGVCIKDKKYCSGSTYHTCKTDYKCCVQ